MYMCMDLFKTILFIFPLSISRLVQSGCLTSRQSVELCPVIDADVLILIIVLEEQSG